MFIKLFFTIFLLLNLNLLPRNVHRPHDPSLGYIKTSWENSDQEYFLRDSHLREIPIFHTYNHEHFMEKLLPETITCNDETKKITNSELNELIEKLYSELKSQKTKFTNFKTLKHRDYNKFNKTGNIILKFNDYPLILKLFIETPESLSKPFSKAFQARGIFNLGGSFRHLMGFTRIKNLELIEESIKDHPEWKDKIELPRKWFWLPKEPTWIEITGYNLGDSAEQHTKIPAVYALVCDLMPGREDDPERINYYNDYLRLCTHLHYTLDAHTNNFLVKDKKILLIDTEHFAILSGNQKKLEPVTDYTSWYIRVAKKYIKEKFLSDKAHRRFRQANNKTEVGLFS
ncbi:MAG: hypothetical protein P4L22_05010 [Candidatus Babeliales bacterium]|nr:hypothetical protein [Candidatus Babeliales bacterium]